MDKRTYEKPKIEITLLGVDIICQASFGDGEEEADRVNPTTEDS